MMLKTVAPLTPSALSVALTEVAEAKSEKDCALALVAAATRLQEAVLSHQDPESFHDALDSCPPHLSHYLNAAVDRAVNFHGQEDGGTLGLWLLPVAMTIAQPLSGIIPLDVTTSSGSLTSLRLSSALLKQFKISAENVGPGRRVGWTYVIPALYSDETLNEADMGELVRLPLQARAAVRGDCANIHFAPVEQAQDSVDMVHLYYLPVVVYHPEGCAVGLPDSSEQTMHRMTRWLQKTLPNLDANAVRVASQPQPFSVALGVGERMRNDIKLRIVINTLVQKTGVEPNGMAALVAPYVTQNRDGDMTLGVSLISRLTQSTLATVALPVSSADGAEEAALTTHALRDMGMVCVQHAPHPIDTIECQHCGMIQFNMPNPEIAVKGMGPVPKRVH